MQCWRTDPVKEEEGGQVHSSLAKGCRPGQCGSLKKAFIGILLNIFLGNGKEQVVKLWL